jgi:hypothetical protein
MITYKMLKAKGACESQASLFKELFPNGAPLSVETAVSVADKFDWDWAAINLLTQEGKGAYQEAVAPLCKAYQEAKEPLWKAYQEALAPLYKAYQEAVAPLFAEICIKETEGK